MLKGKWPDNGCEYCKNIEDANGSSDRIFHSSIPDQTPFELMNDPTSTQVTPTILEVYFDNVCNMSCIYCWDGFSSQIQQENIKFGRFEKNGIIIDNTANKVNKFKELTSALWQWMETHHTSLKRFHVLGGEPFFQPQFLTCLDFFDNHPSPDLEFNVVSNIMISPTRLVSQIEKIKQLVDSGKIKRFDLTVSIDCFGPEQEYVRHGLDLRQWKKNFEYIATQHWIHLNVNQTLTALTLKTSPELIEYVNGLKQHREIGHYFSTVVGQSSEFLHPEILGGKFFTDCFDQILSTMKNDTWQEQQAKKYMNGIKLQVESCLPDPVRLKKLMTFLDEIDRRRNLNWRNTFPWLEKELEHVV
jgi:organic radical activating enzyme